jgi:hypothetical protein
MKKPMPYANLLIGCVLIGMHWGLTAGAAAFFIGLALVGTKGPSTGSGQGRKP